MNRKSIARITAASCAFYVAAAGFLQWVMPQIVLPGPGQLIGAALVMPGYILLTCALLTIIPPVVIVRSDKIVKSHGQSATHIPSSSIYKSYLVFHSGDRVRLRVCYTKKNGRKRVLLVAVPAKIDFDKLSDLLPEYPIVRDGRGNRRSKTEAAISDKAFLVAK